MEEVDIRLIEEDDDENVEDDEDDDAVEETVEEELEQPAPGWIESGELPYTL